ncbi:MAG: hypothetical protein U0Q16_23275 [Bryobacteraceae bacterium]
MRKMILSAMMAAVALPPATMAASNKLEGTWLINITFDGTPPPGFPASFPVMHTYSPSGEAIESSSIPTARGAGLGEWINVGPRQYRMTLRFFVKDNAGNVIGYAQVKQWEETNVAKTRLTACRFIGQIFAFSGQQLLNSTGSCGGTRIEVDTTQPAAVNPTALSAADQE